MTDKIFLPFSEELLAAAGNPPGELVPFQLEYRCVRLLDGTYDFQLELPDERRALQSDARIGHAA